MRILVTGATGLLGNNIVRELLSRQEQVRVLVRASSDPRPLEGLEVEVAVGDVTHAASVMAAVEGVDAVVHSAGYVKIGWKDKDDHDQINVTGTENVAAACLRNEARLIHVSSINALGMSGRDRVADETWADPGIVPCPYVVTKRRGEEIIERYVAEGLQASIANPGFMLGPWDWKPSSGLMLLQVAKQWTPFAPRGGVSTSDARDVAAAIVEAIDHAKVGERYVLGGENILYRDLWRVFAEVTQTSGPISRGGPLMVIAAGRFGDLWSRLRGRELEVNSAAVGLSSQFHFFNSSKAAAELTYRVRPLKETVQDTWDWFQQNGYVGK